MCAREEDTALIRVRCVLSVFWATAAIEMQRRLLYQLRRLPRPLYADLRVLLARRAKSGAGSEFFRFAKRVFVVVGHGVIWRVSRTRRPRNGLRRRSISCLERRVAAQRQTGARCTTPRAQPRCNPFIQSRPEGPPQTRDQTKSPDTDAGRDPKGCPHSHVP